MRKTWSAAAIAAAFAVSAFSPSLGATIRVPADQPTIGAGLAAAFAGDTVKVKAGTYFEQVMVKDAVQLLGGYDATYSNQNPPANVTMIHGSGTGAPVTAVGISSATRVDGFKISGGGGLPGAGVIVDGGAPVFSNNTIAGNRQAGIAGGVYIFNGSTALFESNTVINNSSKGSGGGFHITDASPTLFMNDISNNSAPNAGGAVYAFNSMSVIDACTMTGNIAGNGGGGAVIVQNSSVGVTLTNCVLDGCTASFGGGVLVRDASHADITGCDFLNLTADAVGATPDSSVHLGGGLAVFAFCSATVTDTDFDNCTAIGAAAQGGAVYVDRSTIDINGTADPSAGPTSTMTNCSSEADGGAAYVTGATGSLTATLVANCSAAGNGGAMYVEDTALQILENIFSGCVADDGGAIYLSSFSGLPPVSDILNCTIDQCSALDSNGGVIQNNGLRNKRLAFIAGTIVSQTLNGACIDCQLATGGTAAGAKPSINCTTLSLDPANPGTVTANTSCNSAFSSDGTNREGDPVFCNTVPFALQGCSPDVGNLCSKALQASTIDGSPRLNRGATDITCLCGLISLEHLSWGRIKSNYR